MWLLCLQGCDATHHVSCNGIKEPTIEAICQSKENLGLELKLSFGGETSPMPPGQYQ